MRAPLIAPPRSVLLTTDAVGGVWTYALDLASALGAAGMDVYLAVMGPRPDALRRAEALGRPGVVLVETDLPLEWTAREPAELLVASTGLNALVGGLSPDIVHLHIPALAAAAADRPRVPLVASLHSCVATWWAALRPNEPMPPDLRWRTDLVSRGLAAADAVITPSRSLAAAASAIYPRARFHVVLNGRSAPHRTPSPTGRRGVFTSGRLWDEAKNASTLDAAARLLPFPIFAAGPVAGPHGGGTAEYRHLHLLGQLSAEEIRHWLDASAIYVSAARYEPFGLGVLEAAQSGCALVLSDIPSFRELWSGAAWFVPPEDARAFASALRELTGNEEERRRLAAAAADRAERYSAAAMVDGSMAVYRHLLARSVERGAA
jgi:glycosyltransferase involved in cell wall biosynthesis